MLQSLGQIVYTSFPNIGFRHLSSPQVPKEIQYAFVHQVVYLRWNSYNPPAADYRAAYLHQVNANHVLFGWLYGDATDDVGRNVPYFIGYHFAAPLSEDHLNSIFICLQRGPLSIVNQRDIKNGVLENISIPDAQDYTPARVGVDIPQDIRNYSRTFLQMQELLNIFVPASDRQSQLVSYQKPHTDDRVPAQSAQKTIIQPAAEQESVSETPQAESSSPKVSQDLRSNPESLGESYLDQILYELIAKPIGIQSACLVSVEGQPITSTVGIGEDSALIIAGTMLYLARTTHEELQWQGFEKITIQAQEGYIILACCTPDVFLLVKAAKALSGLLNGEINRTVKRLQTALEIEHLDKETELSPETRTELITQLNLDQPVAKASASTNPTHEVHYRGNGNSVQSSSN